MTRASILGCDNDASVKMAFSATSVKRDLHTLHKTEFIQETQAEGEILPTKVRSEDNRSNILSKIIREPMVFKRPGARRPPQRQKPCPPCLIS